LTINKQQKLVKKHVGTSFYGNVDLSVPIDQKILRLEIRSDDVVIRSQSIELPRVTHGEMAANITSVPTALSHPDYGVVDPSVPFTALIEGYNLWRNPVVFVGGRQHDHLEFASKVLLVITLVIIMSALD
jgi:hypothetical protein